MKHFIQYCPGLEGKVKSITPTYHEQLHDANTLQSQSLMPVADEATTVS